jgi:endoglucanase
MTRCRRRMVNLMITTRRTERAGQQRVRSVRAFLFAVLLAWQPCLAAEAPFTWGPYRGFTGKTTLSEKDIAELAATGATLLRATAATRPLMNAEPPYDINMENVALLDAVIDACAKHGLKVVIDPHTTPGTSTPYTTRASDPLWNDYYWHGHLVRQWAFIAERYRNRGDVVVGYDLFNEPFLPGDMATTTSEPGPGNWNELIGRLVHTVRHYDTNMPLIIETAGGYEPGGAYINRLAGLQFLQLPPDTRLVLSPHVYDPGRFTHQGVLGFPTGLRYPVGGQKGWNAERLAEALRPFEEFSLRTGVPVFVGEFSASLHGGDDADRYVADLINLFNAKGWSWVYHSWRDAPPWDAERTRTAEGYTPRAQTPRLAILTDGIAGKPVSGPAALAEPVAEQATEPAAAPDGPSPPASPPGDAAVPWTEPAGID